MGHNGRGIKEASQGRQEAGPQVDGGKSLTPALERDGRGWAGTTLLPSPPALQGWIPRPRLWQHSRGRRASPVPMAVPKGAAFVRLPALAHTLPLPPELLFIPQNLV